MSDSYEKFCVLRDWAWIMEAARLNYRLYYVKSAVCLYYINNANSVGTTLSSFTKLALGNIGTGWQILPKPGVSKYTSSRYCRYLGIFNYKAAIPLP